LGGIVRFAGRIFKSFFSLLAAGGVQFRRQILIFAGEFSIAAVSNIIRWRLPDRAASLKASRGSTASYFHPVRSNTFFICRRIAFKSIANFCLNSPSLAKHFFICGG
jgi:hypothetical protein